MHVRLPRKRARSGNMFKNDDGDVSDYGGRTKRRRSYENRRRIEVRKNRRLPRRLRDIQNDRSPHRREKLPYRRFLRKSIKQTLQMKTSG